MSGTVDIRTQLAKRYGVSLVTASELPPVSACPTGSTALDVAIGIGGYPRRRLVEIYGKEGTGKTTLALHAAAQAQARGLTAAFIDAEHALDPRYAHACGVDLAKLLVAQPDTAEQVFDCARDLVASGAVGLLVIDSTAALRPRVETEDAFGDHHQGLHARAMSKACRLLCSLASNHDCCVIFISQMEPVFGVTFGPSEVATGGNSLKFYASIRIELQLLGRTDGGAPRIRARVQKNKLAPPFRTAAFAINCGRLVDIEVSP